MKQKQMINRYTSVTSSQCFWSLCGSVKNNNIIFGGVSSSLHWEWTKLKVWLLCNWLHMMISGVLLCYTINVRVQESHFPPIYIEMLLSNLCLFVSSTHSFGSIIHSHSVLSIRLFALQIESNRIDKMLKVNSIVFYVLLLTIYVDILSMGSSSLPQSIMLIFVKDCFVLVTQLKKSSILRL